VREGSKNRGCQQPAGKRRLWCGSGGFKRGNKRSQKTRKGVLCVQNIAPLGDIGGGGGGGGGGGTWIVAGEFDRKDRRYFRGGGAKKVVLIKDHLQGAFLEVFRGKIGRSYIPTEVALGHNKSPLRLTEHPKKGGQAG